MFGLIEYYAKVNNNFFIPTIIAKKICYFSHFFVSLPYETKEPSSMNLTVSIISKSEELPYMECRDFFHSIKMFRIAEKTPGFTPFMAIAQREDGSVAAHLLATIRRRGSWIPPYLFTQGRIYGEGEYDADINKDETFGMMLDAITTKFVRRLCLYVEFSNMSQKMFGYRHFRRNKYFPINWQEVHI